MKTGKDTIGFLVNDAARLMRKDFERRARSLGLTRAQWQTMFHLARNEGCNQATLADLLDVEPITLARVIDRLELSGLVERRADPTDRRARLLFLGERAHPLLEELRALGAETREIALNGISDDERTLLMTLLTRMRANLSGRDPATAAA
ncbi:MAG TPA: MarR family transcriptional regulator [Dongiaceae bacterium]|jgi:DNA-binding MarR family transcriptional regulator|nr:MarR family transcriptional regulator [Dongiaceae bacterium]